MPSSLLPAHARLRRRVRQTVTVLIVELVVLALTGLVLWFVYTPKSAPEWDDIYSVMGTARLADAVRQTHRLTSWLMVLTALVALVLMTLDASRPFRRRTMLAGAGVFVVSLAAVYTGTLVAWDQLALWAVTVGTDFEGYRPLLDDQVKWVLVDGSEVSTATLLWWLAAHLALGCGAGLLTGLAWRRARQDSSELALLEDQAGAEG